MAEGEDPDRPSRPGSILSLGEEWWATRLHALRLGGLDPDRIHHFAKATRRGEAARGEALLSGRWHFGGTVLAVSPGATPWSFRAVTGTMRDSLHGFSWLRDLAAAGAPGRALIAASMREWVGLHGTWDVPHVWHPDVTAERVIAWLSHGQPGFEGDDPQARVDLLRSLGRQVRHLSLTQGVAREPRARMRMATALTLAGTALRVEKVYEQGIELLQATVRDVVLPDGGHVTRCPEALAECFFWLLDCEEAVMRRPADLPAELVQRRARMADMLHFLRLGDGGLTAANGGGSGPVAALDAVLREHPRQSRFRIANTSGFVRVEAGGLVMVIDAGAAPPPVAAANAHAGCLAFEMSDGDERIVVNAGSGFDYAARWRRMARHTDRHSTLELGDRDSAEFEARGAHLGPVSGPPGVHRMIQEDRIQTWIEMRHEGYREAFGLVHTRRIHVSGDGQHVRGEDSLFRPLADGSSDASASEIPYGIHFHLAPGITVSPASDVDPRIAALRLTTPRGRQWLLRTDSAAPRVLPSNTQNGVEGMVENLQIVLRGMADPRRGGDRLPNRVRWALIRLDAAA
jgi:uncharacterized heparinase superfamily protein